MDIWNKLIKSVVILCTGIILGLLLIIGVFCLPTGKMHENVKRSLPVFESGGGTYPQLVTGYYASRLDNFTDAIMLTNVINETIENPVVNALVVNRISYDEPGPVQALTEYANGNSAYHTYSYGRYWHGYLVFLKPLFLFFDYQGVRMILMSLQMLSVLLMTMLLCKRGLTMYLLPFVAMLIYLYPPALAMSLQFSTVYFIAMIAAIVLLQYGDQVILKDYLFFLTVGMATGYFDFLTYPLLTLGMPLIIYFILYAPEGVRSMLLKWLELCIFWAFGYLGMWAGKWIIASVLTDYNVLLEASERLLLRTSREIPQADATQVIAASTIDIIKRNLNVMMTKRFFVILLFAMFIFIIVCKKRRKIKLDVVISSVPIFLTGMLPFAWYLCTGNHSYVHFWFTYRTMAVTVFGGMSAVVKILCEITVYE